MAADSLVNEAVTVSVSFRTVPAAGQPDLIVTPAPDVESYQLRVSGPRKSIARIQAAAPITARLQIPDQPTGRHGLRLKDVLQEQWHEFPKLSVVSVDPPLLPIVIDHMVPREVVVLAQQLTLPYEVKPQLQPSSVMVRMRESAVETLSSGGQFPPLDISKEAEKLLRSQLVGQSVSVMVTLDARPYGPDATFQPNSIEVRATLTSMRTTTEIPTVPILLAVSFANFPKAYRAMPRDGGELVTQTIKVTGSTEEVGRLLRGETRAYGIIQLKDEHLADIGSFKPFTPEFQLPVGIELAEKPKPLELKLVDATRPEPTQAP